MSFDYIEITKSLSKDKICIDYLEKQAAYNTGWIKYYHEGCKALEIWIQPNFSNLKIKGSFPYFIAGQNFKTELPDFANGLNYLASVLDVNLYEAQTKTFEFGTTLEVPFPTKFVMNTHIEVKGMKVRNYDNGRYFEDSVLLMKLYDAGKNIKKKLSYQERERLKVNFGYNPSAHYIRIENKYLKPETYFKRRPLYVNDLIEPDFQEMVKQDLINKYRSIMKAKQANLSHKKQLTSSTIPLLILKEYEQFLPCKIEDLIKDKIKSIPTDILSKEDKKARNRQIKSNLIKLDIQPTSGFDLSGLLEQKLNGQKSNPISIN